MLSSPVSRVAALATLGLKDPCSPRDIARAYRRLARATHPDMTGVLDDAAKDRFTSLADAYRSLTPPSGSGASASTTLPPSTVAGLRAHDLFLEGVPYEPPIVAGPVCISPLPSHPRGAA